MSTKKLIEVALPLEKINAESAREKSIRHGHPSTLHLWWARRPLAAARAVIWSSLVDDPSSHPDRFPTEEAQNAERQRLFRILENLVVWENSNKPAVLDAAKAEILKSTDNNPPALLDPFAGGGAIPLEAQRLGLEAHAHDLNPVAVMINKAMIEIPPRFAGNAPANPEARERIGMKDGTRWSGASGLAEDVRYYGEWMKAEAFRRIGHLYPKVKLPAEQGGGEATVIAWIWARTVKCPNPACGCEMPLASSLVLSTKKGNEAYVEPLFDYQAKRITYSIKHDKGQPSVTAKLARGAKFQCIMCKEIVPSDYIKEQAISTGFGNALLGIVCEGKKGRLYLSPDVEQSLIAQVATPDNAPSGELAYDPKNLWTPAYGLDTYEKLFTPRQLTALTTFSSLIAEAQKKAEQDAVDDGYENDHIALADGGCGARAYGEAVGAYLAFVVDKMTDYHSSICSWNPPREGIRNTFGRQAIPMVWDYAEANPFSNSSGCFDNMMEWVYKAICELPADLNAEVSQFDAQSDCNLRNIMVSTDPPYYDNIGYADLSDFFYVWMRQGLKNTFPNLFRTMLVPKAEELVATPYRFGGSAEKARDFFEDGMLSACKQMYQYSRDDIPVTIYYAYKQSDTSEEDNTTQTASTGWETMLSAIIQAGFTITGTWPMNTEREGRTIGNGTNALASSIVLVCRKRPADAPTTTRRGFINELKRELRPALKKLQSSNIAPVDLAQSAIGPGMGVFSRYARVLESDGKPMSVRSALQIINEELDLFFNEQDSDIDKDTRFCVEIFTQYAFNELRFGDADTLARAKNTSVSMLASKGILSAQKGVVRLLGRDEIPEKVESNESTIWLLTQQMTRALLKDGVQGCARIVAGQLNSTNPERAKDLAYRLYTVCERKKWAEEGYAYNSLVAAWPEVVSAADELRNATDIERDQMTMDFGI